MNDLERDFLSDLRGLSAIPRFRGANSEAQATVAHEWILAGPAETGKTWAALWRLDTEMRRTPGAQAILTRKIRSHMGGTVLRTWRSVIGIRGKVILPPHGGERPEWYDYQNGSRVYIVGMDDSGKVLSGEYDFIYVNQAEELSLQDWEMLSMRVTGRGAVTKTPMLFGDCNPGQPSHWIRHRQTLKLLSSRHEDNPSLFDDLGRQTPQGKRTLERLDGLTGVRKERYRHGRWVSAEGVVYEDFDAGVHLIEASAPKCHPSWRRVCGIDFGFTNPFAWVCYAIDGDGRMYLEDEIYQTGLLVEDAAAEILRRTEDKVIEATITDHDPEKVAQLEKAGIRCTLARKDVALGIQAVQKRLRKAGDGRPRLFFRKDALKVRDEELEAKRLPLCTADEIEVYSWVKGADGKPSKEEPAKAFDHGLDATRYVAMHLETAPGEFSELAEGTSLGSSDFESDDFD